MQAINRRCNKNKTSRVTSVYYNKGKKCGSPLVDGNRITGSFSSKKYGYDEACTLALNERARMIRSLPHYVEALQLNVDDQ